MVPGRVVLSTNAVAGVFEQRRHAWARAHLEPVRHSGYTYHWFEVADEAFDRFLSEERSLRPTPPSSAACADVAWTDLAPGERFPLVREEAPPALTFWVLCVSARRTSDLSFRVADGGARFGVLRDGTCEARDNVREGQASWFRLEPGVHAFCLLENPNRRPWLPYRLEAGWRVRGRRVLVHLRREGGTTPPPAAERPEPSS